jgi:hypothetical protein
MDLNIHPSGMVGIASKGRLGEPGHVVFDYVIEKRADAYQVFLLRDDIRGESMPRLRHELEAQILTAHGL